MELTQAQKPVLLRAIECRIDEVKALRKGATGNVREFIEKELGLLEGIKDQAQNT